MALPDAQDVKDYLKVETDEEDDLIEGITDSAHAWLTAYFGVPLSGTERTFYARYPREGRRKEAACQLVIPVIPCSDTATITDGFEDEVDARHVHHRLADGPGRYGAVRGVRQPAV
jgi:hypothetical protein